MDKTRNTSIDASRLIAAFGVVMIHLSPSTPAAGLVSQIFSSFAVPFFLTMALVFFHDKVSGPDRVTVSHLRLDRILVPYAVWTLFYLASRLFKYHIQHTPFHPDFVQVFFYGGTGVQMYFLPLLLLFQVLTLALLLIFRNPGHRGAGFFLLVGAGIFGYFGSQRAYLGFGNCFERGGLYVLLALLLRHGQATLGGRWLNLLAGGVIAALTVVATVVGYHAKWLDDIAGPLAGYGVAALTLNLRLPSPRAGYRFLLTCSYGIYLAHALFLEAFEFAASRVRYEMTPYSVMSKVLMSILICSCCVVLIWVARLHRISAYCLLGESPRRFGMAPT